MLENPSQESEIVYTKELLSMKMDIQRDMLNVFFGDDQDKKLEWIDKHSDVFQKIFERKIGEENLIERYRTEKEKIVEEIAAEIEGMGIVS